MPPESPQLNTKAPSPTDGDPPHLPSDEEFDHVFPERVRASSEFHWTSVEVCRQAATWLVTGPGTRVLDIGCGPGKFCAIGAMTTPGHFTGVEQRRHLCRAARDMFKHYQIKRAQILHANVTEVAFNCFDAFYLFNPFEENLIPILKIDDEVPVYFELYDRYINHVRRELSQMRIGTRVVTFWGDCDEIPPGYECVETAANGELRLWINRGAGAFEKAARETVSLPETFDFAIN